MFAIGLLAFYFVQRGDYISILIGTFFLHLNSIADGIDGELARIKFLESPLGEWLDRISDKLVGIMFFAAILIGHSRTHPSLSFLVFGLITVIGLGLGYALLFFYGYRFKDEIYEMIQSSPESRDRGFAKVLGAMIFGSVYMPDGDLSLKKFNWLGILNLVLKNDFLCLFYLMLAVAGILPLVLYGIATYATYVFCLSVYGFSQPFSMKLREEIN